MKKIGVIFGGVTCEHDVSIVTGIQLINNIDKSKFIQYIFILMANGMLTISWWTQIFMLNLINTKILLVWDALCQISRE